jgi:DNA-binding CsgD family transcriptional regulator
MLCKDSRVDRSASETGSLFTLGATHAGQPSPSPTTQPTSYVRGRGWKLTAAARSGSLTGGVVRALPVDPEHTVTPQELEVLALYASGYSYEEIGAIKIMSQYTVRNWLRRAVARSGARNATHLTSICAHHQIIRLAASGNFEPVQDLRIAGE